MAESKKSSEKVFVVPTDRAKLIAAICYVLFVIGYFTTEKNSPFVKFHMQQSLTLLVFSIILSMIGIIPILGWLIAFFGGIICFILFIIGIINALRGKEKELPIIGKYADIFSL